MPVHCGDEAGIPYIGALWRVVLCATYLAETNFLVESGIPETNRSCPPAELRAGEPVPARIMLKLPGVMALVSAEDLEACQRVGKYISQAKSNGLDRGQLDEKLETT